MLSVVHPALRLLLVPQYHQVMGCTDNVTNAKLIISAIQGRVALLPLCTKSALVLTGLTEINSFVGAEKCQDGAYSQESCV